MALLYISELSKIRQSSDDFRMICLKIDSRWKNLQAKTTVNWYPGSSKTRQMIKQAFAFDKNFLDDFPILRESLFDRNIIKKVFRDVKIGSYLPCTLGLCDSVEKGGTILFAKLYMYEQTVFRSDKFWYSSLFQFFKFRPAENGMRFQNLFWTV